MTSAPLVHLPGRLLCLPILRWYCWWKKFCSNWNIRIWNPMKNEILSKLSNINWYRMSFHQQYLPFDNPFLFSSGHLFRGHVGYLCIYTYIAYHIPANSIYCNVSNTANEDFHTWSLLFSVRRSLFTLHQGFFKESLQCLAVQKDTDQPKKTHPQTHWPMISVWPMFFRLSQNATKVGLIFCFGKKVRHVRSPHVIGLVDFF